MKKTKKYILMALILTIPFWVGFGAPIIGRFVYPEKWAGVDYHIKYSLVGGFHWMLIFSIMPVCLIGLIIQITDFFHKMFKTP